MLLKLWNRYKEIVLYLIFGVLTTGISLLSYAVCVEGIKMEPLIANVISWIFAVLFAYVTNRLLVFSSQARGIRQIFREMMGFFGGRLATLLLEEAFLFICINCVGLDAILVKLMAQVAVVIGNYIISKWLVFR